MKRERLYRQEEGTSDRRQFRLVLKLEINSEFPQDRIKPGVGKRRLALLDWVKIKLEYKTN